MTKLYGASDDLIELHGDLYEEFDRYDSEGDYLAFSDGTVVFMYYDDNGIWRIRVDFKGGLFDRKEEGDIESDTNDVVYFKDGLKWCVIGKELAK
jgi:hypothetical protein